MTEPIQGVVPFVSRRKPTDAEALAFAYAYLREDDDNGNVELVEVQDGESLLTDGGAHGVRRWHIVVNVTRNY